MSAGKVNNWNERALKLLESFQWKAPWSPESHSPRMMLSVEWRECTVYNVDCDSSASCAFSPHCGPQFVDSKGTHTGSKICLANYKIEKRSSFIRRAKGHRCHTDRHRLCLSRDRRACLGDVRNASKIPAKRNEE